MTAVAVPVGTNAVEWLNDLEHRLRPKYAGVSLAIEVDVDLVEADKALRAIGLGYRKTLNSVRNFDGHSRSGVDHASKLLTRWPGSLVLAMVGAAAQSYEHGTYWPHLMEAAGLSNHQEHQQRFGRAFLRALETLGLARFNLIERPFLGPILMHAGIPNACLADLLDLLIARRHLDPGLDGVSFMAWALDPKVANRLASVDVPVRNFLQDGGEFALDVMERTLELLEYLNDNRDSQSLTALSTETTGLPGSMVDQIVELILGGSVRLDRLPSSADASRARIENPKLTYDWIQGAVLMSLPAVKTQAGAMTWHVAADGVVRTVGASVSWIGEGQHTAATAIRIMRPAQRVLVTNLENGRQTAHGLVDPADPMLLFDGSGDLLIPTLPIPTGRVWVLYPAADATIVDQDGNGVAFVMEDQAPAGWDGWHVAQIDISALRAIRLERKGASGRLRIVRHDNLPVIQLGDSIPGLRNLQGSPVYSALPTLLLPEDPHRAIKWDIEVRQSGQPQAVYESRGLSTPASRIVGIFGLAQPPVLGTYTIKVRGPLGRGASQTFTLAQGLEVTCEPRVRMLNGPRLQPAIVTVLPTAGGTVPETSIHFDGSSIEKIVRVSDGRREMALVVSPLRMETLIDAPGIPPSWTPAVARLTPEALAPGSSLMVRLPDEDGPISLQLRAAQGETQTVLPAARRSGSPFRFSLAKFADTVRRAGRSQLFIRTTTQSILVATVRPRLQASGAVSVDGGLRLLEYSHAPGIKAAIYVDTAPWVKPEICDVQDDGTIALPPHLGSAGNLSIILAEDDGWTSIEWPRWPSDDRVHAIRAGYRASEVAAENELSRLLGKPGDVQLTDAHLILDKLWFTLSVASQVCSGEAGDKIVSVIRHALLANQDQALLALSHTQLPLATLADVMIRSRFAEQPFAGVHELQAIQELWPLNIGPAALLATATLCSDTGPNDLGELEADVSSFGGQGMLALLHGRADPDRETPKFDETARRLGQMRSIELEQLWQSAQVVPEGLLQRNSRTTAARELFDVRNHVDMKFVFSSLASEIPRLKREVRSSAIVGLIAQLDARLDTGAGAEVWQFLPALSFCYAARARLAAWRPAQFGPLGAGSRRSWRALASLAPSFFTLDLVLADALIAGSSKPQIDGAL